MHAAGVILSEYPIDQIIPVEYSKEMPTTGIDMTYLEANGLLKMDFLSVNNLGIIHNIIKDINTNLTIDNIPENDPKTLSIFNQGDLIGIFQFDGAGMISFMKKFKPRKLTDVHAAMALYRPGPMENIPSYVARHEGKEEITYLDKRLEPILKDTYGIIVYQEQVMQIAVSLAGFTMGRADSLRKAMSKKKAKEMQTLKEEFLNGCINNGMTEEKAETIFAYIQKFASYGFNKSHSVGYSKIAYQMAYLKAHYRPYFMKNFLNSSIGSSDSIKTYVTETRDNGVEVYAPDINISTHEFELKNNALVFPLTGLKDVGTSSVHQIVEERLNGQFTDIYDFLKRCYSKSVNKKVIESLILGGCFDNLGINRQTLYNNLPELLLYGEVKDCLDLDLKPVLIEEEEFSHNMLLEFEKEIYGFYLLHHPVTDYKNEKSIDIKDLKNHIDAQVNLILLVDRFREITTKKGDKMAFVTGSDESGNLELAIFPKTYEKHNDLHLQGVYNFKCKVECTDGVIKGIIRDFKYLS